MTIVLLLLLLLLTGGSATALALLFDRWQQQKRASEELAEKLRLEQQHKQTLLDRFRPIVSLDQEVAKLRNEVLLLSNEHKSYSSRVAAQRQAFADEYARLQGTCVTLRQELSRLEGSLEDTSFGVYKPHYPFDSSEHFREQLDHLRAAKKQSIRSEIATRCLVAWTVEGSREQGERMQKQLAKLMLRAFNGECDAAVANVNWNNALRMEERIRKAFEAINKLGTIVQVVIVPEYFNIALSELRLQFEYQEKKRAEAEEQRRIKEQMRDEERAQRELQRAEREAADDETRYAKALGKALAEASRAKGAELLELNEKVKQLEADLAAAQARHARAISMAQLTRCGYVYVISNIGSFGEDVFKLGMTRRLDPMDRVWELSDASVPFDFDVHGMIYSEDAPALESALHQFFTEHRVNRVNPRKEFFRITIDLIQQFLDERGLQIELTKLAEAREFRESVAVREGAETEASSVPAYAEHGPVVVLE